VAWSAFSLRFSVLFFASSSSTGRLNKSPAFGRFALCAFSRIKASTALRSYPSYIRSTLARIIIENSRGVFDRTCEESMPRYRQPSNIACSTVSSSPSPAIARLLSSFPHCSASFCLRSLCRKNFALPPCRKYPLRLREIVRHYRLNLRYALRPYKERNCHRCGIAPHVRFLETTPNRLESPFR